MMDAIHPTCRRPWARRGNRRWAGGKVYRTAGRYPAFREQYLGIAESRDDRTLAAENRVSPLKMRFLSRPKLRVERFAASRLCGNPVIGSADRRLDCGKILACLIKDGYNLWPVSQDRIGP